MTNFVTMTTRVATELRRSNLLDEIKRSINDAIKEAATTRFFFNEMKGVTFATVVGQEYYANPGLMEIDSYYYFPGGSRLNLQVDNNLTANARATGNTVSGQITNVSVFADKFRIYPVPAEVFTVSMDGFGALTPSPLVNEADTNAWLTAGESYIRALTKRNIQRDIVKDYGDSLVLNAIATDYRTQLLEATTSRISTGTLKGTNW